ncbi:MAG: grxC [Rickettsiaceae bacterium]|jgi:glutaredoxin 3|nr:grxC [Rickettsiaceae bacterium]
MSKIIIYTTDYCPYCVRAKSLLQRKNAAFEEIKIIDDQMREEMIKKSGGRRTVPQIFINNIHIGGCDDLHNLDREGKLDDLLK